MRTIKKKFWVLQDKKGNAKKSIFCDLLPVFYRTKCSAVWWAQDGETPIKVTVTVEQGDE